MSKTTATQYTVPLTNEPGTLAKLTKVVANEGGNILAIATENISDVSLVRFIVEKGNNISKALETAGYQVYTQPAFWVELTNKPGEMNRLAKSLGEQDINILNIYASCPATETWGYIALVVDKPAKAAPLLAKWYSDGKTTARVGSN